MKLKLTIAILPLLLVAALSAEAKEENVTKSQDAKAKEIQKGLADSVADFWIYEDLNSAQTESARTGKPLLVSFR